MSFTYRKRINHEIRIIENKEVKENYDFKYDLKYLKLIDDKIFVTVNNKFKDISFVIDFYKVKYEYPFIPPIISINNFNYLEYLCKSSGILIANKDMIKRNLDLSDVEFKRIFKYSIKCLGCNSILCKANWHPLNNINIIINEVVRNYDKLNKFTILLLIKKITEKFTNQNIYKNIYDFI